MWVALINAITAAVIAIVHYFSNIPASHAIAWLTITYFAVKQAPEKIPTTPQQFWTWGRETLQGFVETKGLPTRPTQPVPPAPEQLKQG